MAFKDGLGFKHPLGLGLGLSHLKDFSFGVGVVEALRRFRCLILGPLQSGIPVCARHSRVLVCFAAAAGRAQAYSPKSWYLNSALGEDGRLDATNR